MLLSELNMEIPHVPRLSNEYAELFFHWFEWLKADCHAGDLRNMAKPQRRIPQIGLQLFATNPENIESPVVQLRSTCGPLFARGLFGDIENHFH